MNEHDAEHALQAWLEGERGREAPGGLRDRVHSIPNAGVSSRGSRPNVAIRGWVGARMIWAVVLVGLLLALAIGVFAAGSHGPLPVVEIPTPSPSPAASATPSTNPSPSASEALGQVQRPCAITGVLAPGANVSIPTEGLPGIDPATGRVAIVDQVPNQPWQIWLSDAGLNGAGLMATFYASQTRQSPQVRGSSSDGSTLLVSTQNVVGGGPSTDKCGDLFLVRTNGSSVTKLTANTPGSAAEGAVLGPDGRSVAYVEGVIPTNGTITRSLHLIDASGVDHVLDSSPCDGGQFDDMPSQSGDIAWSPDGTQVAVSCDTGVASTTGVDIYPTAGGAPRVLPLPAGTTEAGLAWAADGRHILVAAPNSSAPPGPLTVLSINVDTGSTIVVSRTLSIEWGVPFPVNPFSPDRKWLLATDGSSDLYLVNVATGAARQVVGQSDSGGEFQWLPDSSGFVFTDYPNQTTVQYPTLAERGVAAAKTRTIGFMPYASSYYWIGP